MGMGICCRSSYCRLRFVELAKSHMRDVRCEESVIVATITGQLYLDRYAHSFQDTDQYDRLSGPNTANLILAFAFQRRMRALIAEGLSLCDIHAFTTRTSGRGEGIRTQICASQASTLSTEDCGTPLNFPHVPQHEGLYCLSSHPSQYLYCIASTHHIVP